MHGTLAFVRQAARSWRETGAVVPSTRRLAERMAKAVGPLAPGQVIVELGAGTGVCTQALVARYPANPVVAVEMNPVFAARLQAGFPALTIVQGCASQLPGLLRSAAIEEAAVGAVVSGLPLLSLPRETAQAILAAVVAVLAPGRPFVQFTYAPWAFHRLPLQGLQCGPEQRVWMNLPPAVVMPFVRR